MRPILRVLGTRYGIALVLIVLVLGVVGALKGINGSRTSSPLAGGPAVESSAASGSIDPSAGDDSVFGDQSPPPPSTSPGATPPGDVAVAFATAWLAHDGVTGDQWRKGLQPNATAALLEKLKDTDPADVPARHITGPVTFLNQNATLVIAVLPLDAGVLRLRLVNTTGRWLVDGIDWGRS
jgi:hypothetical protein